MVYRWLGLGASYCWQLDLIPFGPLYQHQADAVLRIFKELVIADVGTTMGEMSRQWVIDFVGAIFSAYDDQVGIRLIREFFLLI